LIDFKPLYDGARCLVDHSDPYRQSDLLRVYRLDEAVRPPNPASLGEVVTLYVNVPTLLVLTTPLALLAWGPAHVTWMLLIAACFILAACLMWGRGARDAPVIAGALVCVFLSGSELLLEVGNAAGIAMGLCVIAAWCFLEERFVRAGMLCFALSLLIKPHVTGPILLYFLLAGGKNRKRALETVALTAVLGLIAVLWVTHVAPHWYAEWHANLRMASARGGVNDPGPTVLDTRAHGASMISLQSIFSLIRDDPGFYNPASYLVGAPFLIIWAVTVIRRRFSEQGAWLALAAVAALSMLPLYHRQNDTRLLLLTVPAMAVLWAAGGITARLGLLVTGANAFFTGDIVVQALGKAAHHFRLPTYGIPGQLLNFVLIRPVPLILLVTGTFYLWAYMRYPSGLEASAIPADSGRQIPAQISPPTQARDTGENERTSRDRRVSGPRDRNPAVLIDKPKQSGEALSHD
jgi:hypothetical protein